MGGGLLLLSRLAGLVLCWASRHARPGPAACRCEITFTFTAAPAGRPVRMRWTAPLLCPLLLQVDQFFGANAQQLQDHVWLQSQDVS